MKFLIALSVFASATAFAQNGSDRFIKCYGPAQQGEDAELVYKLKAYNGSLWLVEPFHAQMALNQDSCLESYVNAAEAFAGRSLELCRGEGQRINGYIPIEAQEYGEEEETVYCEQEIKRWFYNRDSTTL